MSTNSKLESYLTTLNEHLGAISVSDRSEIIMEIKSHVTDTLDKNPNKSIEDALRDFGSAESVAKRYLEERGIKTPQIKRSPLGTFVKWTLIASASVMILLSLSLLFLIKSISPLVEVNDDKVSILGGFVHVTDDEVRIGDRILTDDEPRHQLKGSTAVDKAVRELKVRGLNGRIDLIGGDKKDLSWKCKVDKTEVGLTPQKQRDSIELDFTQFKKIRCDIFVPAKLSSHAFLKNGRIDVSNPQGNFDVDLKNGYIGINPKADVAYNFDVKVERGMSDDFESSFKKDAFMIKARLDNGRITNGLE